MPHDFDHEELLYQYLREFHQHGDTVNSDQFDEIAAGNMGLDPTGDTFKSIQSEAEDLIHEEMCNWMNEAEPDVEWQPDESLSDEEVMYINVDFADGEEDEMDWDADWALVGQQLDIQVFHMDENGHN